MGYDLHITRREDWSGTGSDIPALEWLDYVKSHPTWKLDLRNGPHFAVWSGASSSEPGWLDWSEGNLFTKNPSEPLITEMISIAKALDATVQGDDGETYSRDNSPALEQPEPVSPDKPRESWFRWPWRKKADPALLPFQAGDRVRDTFGNLHTVLEIDLQAEHGLGKIRTRRDDGSEHRWTAFAHGLEPAGKR